MVALHETVDGIQKASNSINKSLKLVLMVSLLSSISSMHNVSLIKPNPAYLKEFE